MGWGLRIKKFKIMGVHWKIQFLGEVHEKTIYKRDCLKRAGQFSNLKEGLAKKRGVFSMGVDTPMSSILLHRTDTKHSYFKIPKSSD